jgi:hypothetical protein
MLHEYTTDWSNINLSRPANGRLNMLEHYDFDTLFLEISCNLSEINEATVTAQFEETLKSKIKSAREIFADNLKNIVAEAQKEQAKT